jgi:hypothetical protein
MFSNSGSIVAQGEHFEGDPSQQSTQANLQHSRNFIVTPCKWVKSLKSI